MQKASFLLLAALWVMNPSYGQLPPALKGVLGMEAGDYKFYNQAELQGLYLNKFSERQVEQKEFVEKTVERLNQQFGLLLDSTVYSTIPGKLGLQALSTKSLGGGGQGVAWEDYLAAVNAYTQEKTKYELLINTITQIPGAIKSETNVTAEDSGIVKLPGLLSGETIDFSALLATYRGNLAQLNQKLADMNFILVSPQSGIVNVRGLGYVPDVAFSPEILTKISNQAAGLRGLESKDNQVYKLALDASRRSTQSLMLKFTEEYGSKQSYRVDRTDVETTREGMLSAIVQIMFTRSMTRATYGQPLGTFSLRYDKKKFHIDFIKPAKGIVQFTTDTVWDSAKMYETQAAVYESLNTVRFRVFDGAKQVEKTAIDVFGTMIDPIDIKPAGFVNDSLQVVMGSASYVLGTSELNLTNLFILELVANDINEEIILSTLGTEELKAHFQNRYLGNQVRKEYFSKLRTKMSKQMEQAGFSMETPIGQAYHMRRQVQMFSDRVTLARKLEAQLIAARASSSTHQDAEAREDDLFNTAIKKD